MCLRQTFSEEMGLEESGRNLLVFPHLISKLLPWDFDFTIFSVYELKKIYR